MLFGLIEFYTLLKGILAGQRFPCALPKLKRKSNRVPAKQPPSVALTILTPSFIQGLSIGNQLPDGGCSTKRIGNVAECSTPSCYSNLIEIDKI